MKLAGIIGWPIAQSLSPLLHGYWLKELGIAGTYVPLAARQHDFSRSVDTLARLGFEGVNVTVPHKEAAFALAQALDSCAREVGAVNLLLLRNGRIEGFNTDVEGFAESLNGTRSLLLDRPVVMIGAGGAARAVFVALRHMGAPEIRILNRTASRAKRVGGDYGGGLDDWKQAARDATLVVNATSAGMKGQPSLELDLSVLPPSATVCDIVYNPLETPLLAAAKARGLSTVDGLGMLMHQAVSAFEKLFGMKPKVTSTLRKLLEEALSHG